MNCEEAIRLVEKLADGEASEHEKSQAESHLGRCADCRSHYDFVLALSEASANAPSPEPPSSYWELLPSKVLSRLDRENHPGFWQRVFAPSTLSWGAAAAMLAVVASVSILVLREENASDEARQETAVTLPTPDAVEEPIPAPPASPGVARDEPSPSAPPAFVEEAAPSAPPRARSLQQDAVDVRTADARPNLTRAKTSAEVAERANDALPRAEAMEAEESLDVAAALPSEPTGIEAGVAGEAAPSDAEREYRALRSLEIVGTAGRRSSLRADVAVGDCEPWRDYLDKYGDGPHGTDARYDLARCSIRWFEVGRSEEARVAALGDADAFLAEESEGPRAEEIRAAVAALRR